MLRLVHVRLILMRSERRHSSDSTSNRSVFEPSAVNAAHVLRSCSFFEQF